MTSIATYFLEKAARFQSTASTYATHTGKQLFKIKPIYSHVRQVKMFYKKKKETKIKIYTYNIQGVSYIYSIS